MSCRFFVTEVIKLEEERETETGSLMVLQFLSSALNLNPNSSILLPHTYLLGFSETKKHQHYLYNFRYKYSFTFCRKPRKKINKFTCLLKLGFDDIVAIAENKLLIAASVSAAIGQLSKPFTSVLLYGKELDFKTAFQAGGFPSTHSSAVVATATSLALERGFSDPIFGLSVVYAGLVMYDSQEVVQEVGDLLVIYGQGVRREVGNHAKMLNKMLPKTQDKLMASTSEQGSSSITNAEELGPLLTKEGKPLMPNLTDAPLLLKSDNRANQTSQMLVSSRLAATEGSQKIPNSPALLKESIGHTEVEVLAGALLGFVMSLAVHAIF